MSQEKETCGESSRFQIVTGLASERWSGRLEPNLINMFVFCIMWYCIFVFCIMWFGIFVFLYYVVFVFVFDVVLQVRI